jgi:putative phosphonate metabolism protein
MEKAIRNRPTATDKKRYAIYFAPEEGSSLDTFGQTWLGRDTRGCKTLTQPRLAGVSPQRLLDIVSAPALYGFHGTLKPPFFLSKPVLEIRLFQDIARFASEEIPFFLPKLHLVQMGSFLALMPAESCPALNRLANQCVRRFDFYRRPASIAEKNRRRKAGLNVNQEQYLQQWGYPYVMDEYRFHLTLTGPMTNPILAGNVKKALSGLLSEIELDAIRFESICLFVQEQEGRPFLLHSRYPFEKYTCDKRTRENESINHIAG